MDSRVNQRNERRGGESFRVKGLEPQGRSCAMVTLAERQVREQVSSWVALIAAAVPLVVLAVAAVFLIW
jgi:hypothetical protein